MKKMKTEIKSKNLNPIWNESFVFEIGQLDVSSRIVLTVYDHDSFGSNDIIGATSFSLSEIQKSTVDGLYRLQNLRDGRLFNQLLEHNSNKYGELIGLMNTKKNENEPKITLADFELLSTIGIGSFGLVFQAKSKISGRIVALKKTG